MPDLNFNVTPFVCQSDDQTTKIEDWDSEEFLTSMHIHSQYQITYILKGTGLLFYGNDFCVFNEGDVFLIGAQVPHVFMPNVDAENNIVKMKATTVFFAMNYTPHVNMSIKEAAPILEMFKTGLYCVKAGKKCRNTIIDSVNYLKYVDDGFEKILRMLNIFHIISSDYDDLSNKTDIIFSKARDVARIERVYAFTVHNYHRRIDLLEAATITDMTETAFCRFFKKMTGNSYMQFLIEIRIGMACRSILSDDCNLAEVSKLVGFNSVTNFIKQFKKVMGMTPSDYRQNLRTNINQLNTF